MLSIDSMYSANIRNEFRMDDLCMRCFLADVEQLITFQI